MSLDLNLPQGVELEQENDRLSAGGALDTNVYKGTILSVYLATKNPDGTGTKRIVIEFRTDETEKLNSTTITNTVYISKSTGELTYTKGGKTNPLPGYSQMNSFFLMLLGKSLAEAATETERKTVKTTVNQKDTNIEVDMFTECAGKKIAIGITKISEEGTTKESNYQQGNGNFYDKNEFTKYFDYDTGLTYKEKADGKIAPDFLTQWIDKNIGYVKVKKAPVPAVSTGAVAGTPSTNGTGQNAVTTPKVF